MILKKIISHISAEKLTFLNEYKFHKKILLPEFYDIKILNIKNELFCRNSINKLLKNNEVINFLPNEIIENNFYTPESILDLTFPQYFSKLAPNKTNFFKIIFFQIKKFLPAFLGNLLHNFFKFKIFWQEAIDKKIGILITTKNKIIKCPPSGSLIFEKGTGSIISHIYAHNNLLICPLYQGSLNQNNGLIIFSKSRKTYYFILTKKLKNIFKNNLVLIKSFSESISDSYTRSQNYEIKKLIYIGGKINYGHTIINDSAFLDYLYSKKHPTLNFLFGNYDYLCTLDLNSKINSSFKDNHNFTFINEFNFENNIFSLPNYFVSPLPCYRPSKLAIKILSSQINLTKNESKESAFYFLIDERKGRRELINKMDVLDLICKKLNSKKIKYLILDGMTSIPIYGSSLKVKKNKISSRIIKEAEKVISKNGLKLRSIDGLTLIEKNKVCSKFRIISSFASYGSGMSYPIYILNIPIIIGGTDVVISRKIFKRWHWHFTKYCHPFRNKKEVLIPTNSYSKNGYNLNLGILESYLENNLTRL